VAYIYYTESRLVPIYQSDPNSNPSPASVRLNPQTKVLTAGDEDAYTARSIVQQPYRQVTVANGGTTPDPQPPWWPNGWVLRKFLRKSLKMYSPSTASGETLTGVSYGDYKFSSDAASVKKPGQRFVETQELDHKPPKGPPVYKPGFKCGTCGRLTADHRVYETQNLRTLAQQLVQAYLQANPGAAEPPMFGLLEVRQLGTGNTMLVIAESGFNYHFAALIGQRAATLGTHHYVTAGDVQTIKSAAGNGNYFACDGTTFPVQGNLFSCAAPKLVQYYAHFLRAQYTQPVIYLSEVAVVSMGIYVSGHTAESCDLCRKTIPPMLCGLVNLERQVDPATGRYPHRARTAGSIQ
jgi:hypothetical protein